MAGGGFQNPGGAGRGDKPKLCLNCGGDHHHWQCGVTCSACNTSFCGSRGNASQCPCKKSVLPAREQVFNIQDNPIPPKLYAQLQGIHRKPNGTAGGT